MLLGDIDKYGAYDMNKLIVVPSNPPAAAGPATKPPIYMPSLDRAVSNVAWSADGQHTLVPAAGRSHESSRHRAGRESERHAAAAHHAAGAWSARRVRARTATSPCWRPSRRSLNEVYALEGSNLRQLTKHNDKLLAELQLATTEDFQSKSKDGTEVHGLIVKPAGYKAGTKYPTLLIVHGGPNGQDEHAFNFDREFLAANGYVVLAINYRGSAGRGTAYQKAIHARLGQSRSRRSARRGG